MSKWKVYFNPKCSTCRNAAKFLDDANISYETYEYIKHGLTASEVKQLKKTLKLSSYREMMRVKESYYSENNLAEADEAKLESALLECPKLLQRPILIQGDRAMIARPVEKLEQL